MTDETVFIGMPQSQSLPLPPKSDRADLIEKIKPEQIVEVIRHRLMGEEFINGSWQQIKALENKKISEAGAWEISNLMLGVSSINISISKLSDSEIKNRVFNIAKTVQYLLLSNWREYKIKNVSQLYYVHEIVFSNTLAVLKQAGDGSIQELIKSTVQESRNVQTEKKEGVGSRIKRALGL